MQPGDTVSSIAASFGIDQSYILWNNPEVSDDPDFLVVGQKLGIPSVNGIIYNVRLGDSLSDIASVYQVDVSNVVAFVPNKIASPDTIPEGAVLVLPGAVPPPPPIPAAVAAVNATAPLPEPQPQPQPAPAQPPSSTGYIWPWYGNITTYYGEPRGYGYYHLAIDIDGFGSYGAAVVAAASGQVILTSWDDWGLGYHVIIRHDDGSQTLYAHFSDIWVVQGQYVAQGEAIGGLGCTGYCTGTHLHFELDINGQPVDPLAYLP
ncbi:MAG: M23 family metallopeptidase [Chloroflexi bacterium]|nr:M23 family metallopeptidase [Chloroflexota bacterium]